MFYFLLYPWHTWMWYTLHVKWKHCMRNSWFEQVTEIIYFGLCYLFFFFMLIVRAAGVCECGKETSLWPLLSFFCSIIGQCCWVSVVENHRACNLCVVGSPPVGHVLRYFFLCFFFSNWEVIFYHIYRIENNINPNVSRCIPVFENPCEVHTLV